MRKLQIISPNNGGGNGDNDEVSIQMKRNRVRSKQLLTKNEQTQRFDKKRRRKRKNERNVVDTLWTIYIKQCYYNGTKTIRATEQRTAKKTIFFFAKQAKMKKENNNPEQILWTSQSTSRFQVKKKNQHTGKWKQEGSRKCRIYLRLSHRFEVFREHIIKVHKKEEKKERKRKKKK